LLVKKSAGNPQEIKKRIKELQEEANKTLAQYNELDAAELEKKNTMAYYDSKMKSDSMNYIARVSTLSERVEKAEMLLKDFQQFKPALDSMNDAHRAAFQKQYGNQEIAREVRIANDKHKDLMIAVEARTHVRIKDIGLLDYPLLVTEKSIPFLMGINPWFKAIPTTLFDSAILVLMAVLASCATLAMLSLRGAVTELIQRLRPKRRQAAPSN
jgi:hypothetical protein